MAEYMDDNGTTLVDLTTLVTDDIDATVNGAYFTIEALESSSGTGLIQSFVRLQAGGTEDGYNSSGRPVNDPDVNTSLSFTHDLLLADVPIVLIDGVPHYEFLLDINQTNANPYISLDELQVYTSSTAGLTAGVNTATFQNATDLVYDLDESGNTSILLNYELQSGSGAADMYFYVPVSDFTGNPATTYVYLYSSFGETGTIDASDTDSTGNIPLDLYGSYSTNDGFEEWAVSRNITGPTIDGYKWEDSNANGIWDEGEQALSGWRFDYTYTIGNGNNAVVYSGVAITDENGRYVIPVISSNQSYTITITEQLPEGWTNTYDGDATANGSTQVVIGRNLGNLPDGDPFTTEVMNFGNFQGFDISGTKYTDTDGDGVIDEGEQGLAGVTIYIERDGVEGLTAGDVSTVTDENGNWSFTGLDASYAGQSVYEVTPDGYIQTLGALGYVITGTSGTDQDDLDFANFELFDLSGFKWSDDNGNGVWDVGTETVLEGWTIIVDTDEDPTNGFLLIDVTDASGAYSFEGLNPLTSTASGTGIGGDVLGNYIGQTLYVYEVPQEGFEQTYGGYTFVITSGGDIIGDLGVAEPGNFGNQPDDCNVNRTPGFWQSLLGRSFFDGILDNQGDSNGPNKAGDGGTKDFDLEGWSREDLLDLYGVDLVANDSDPNTSDNDHFAVWDANGDGIEQDGDIFLTVAELATWVAGGPKGGGNDYLSILQRDVAATFLNTLNHNAVCDDGEGDPTLDPMISDAYAAAIRFILEYDPDFNGIANASKNDQRGDWYTFGSDAHTALAAFNESGESQASEAVVPLREMFGSLSDQLVQGNFSSTGTFVDRMHVVVPQEDLTHMTQTMLVA